MPFVTEDEKHLCSYISFNWTRADHCSQVNKKKKKKKPAGSLLDKREYNNMKVGMSFKLRPRSNNITMHNRDQSLEHNSTSAN